MSTDSRSRSLEGADNAEPSRPRERVELPPADDEVEHQLLQVERSRTSTPKKSTAKRVLTREDLDRCTGGLSAVNRPPTKGRLDPHSSFAADSETDPKCFWKSAFLLSFSVTSSSAASISFSERSRRKYCSASTQSTLLRHLAPV